MIQGASLKAAAADCRDVHTTAGLAEMMTAYVILSRVTKADGLLLLRAFNSELFTMGASPGPHCLLKLLRTRFGHLRATDAAQGIDGSYDLTAANREYHELVHAYEAKRTERTVMGCRFRCCWCEETYGTDDFFPDATDARDAVETCLLAGEWLLCRYCSDTRNDGNAKGINWED